MHVVHVYTCVFVKTILCLHLLLNNAMHLSIVKVGE